MLIFYKQIKEMKCIIMFLYCKYVIKCFVYLKVLKFKCIFICELDFTGILILSFK